MKISLEKFASPVQNGPRENTVDAEQICRGYKGLVIKIVWSFIRRRGLKPQIADELIQYGYIGILKAFEKYDPNKGASFATYSTYWINHFILRFLHEERVFIGFNRSRKGRDAFVCSLNEPVNGEEGSKEVGDFVADEDSDFAEESEDGMDLRKALNELSERERQVIALHYGANNLTQVEIAKCFGVSRQNIGIWLKKSREKLRASMDCAA